MKRLWKNYSYAIILVVISIVATTIIKINLSTNHQYMTITVQSGESLWEISQRFEEQHGLSELQFIEWVEKNNGVSRDFIIAGNELTLPIPISPIELGKVRNLASQ
ncbi:LysM peptidoglycan-binding domain-containing protein [Niallia sp. XMNu-256]|uniref:cell division suppressor protein YneA n=1 Tax=Niallia sp. XMNu-256 TaxID=3082444 RepID=UPI0030CFB8DF